MEAKARLPTAIEVGRVTVSKLGFYVNIDWCCGGEMKCRRALVAVWSRAVCLCEADGWLLYFASRLWSWLWTILRGFLGMQGSCPQQNVAALSTLPGVRAGSNALMWKAAVCWFSPSAVSCVTEGTLMLQWHWEAPALDVPGYFACAFCRLTSSAEKATSCWVSWTAVLGFLLEEDWKLWIFIAVKQLL